MKGIILTLGFLLMVQSAFSYKPVVLLHGIGGHSTDFDGMLASIQQVTTLFLIQLIESITLVLKLSVWTSTTETLLSLAFTFNYPISSRQSNNLTTRPFISCVTRKVIFRKRRKNLQKGALICRIALQMMDNHNVDTFVSMSGPQMGQYDINKFLANIF
jgi:palmitoyl-protein thioesterase